MIDHKAKELLQKQETGEIGQSEKNLLDNWYLQQEISDEIPDVKTLLDDQHESAEFLVRYIHQKKQVLLWPRIVATAAAVVLILSGIYFFNYNKNKINNDNHLIVQDVAPGSVGATLTLANGKKIRLSEAVNGELAEESGVVITKAENGQLVYEIKDRSGELNKINTLSTAKGETYRLRLPDGSLVWLNAASSLTYAANLNEHGKRRVKLNGEGYFEIAKDKAHPFVVESSGQRVEVLGTHFNVNAYADEPFIATTLLEGSVKVSVSGRLQLIKPGQQAVNYGGRLTVNEVSLDDITDWKEGDFFLNHVDFKTAMRKIARWYDVEVVYDTAVPDDLESGGWMSRRNNLSTVLKAIEDTGLARFRIEGKTVHVLK